MKPASPHVVRMSAILVKLINVRELSVEAVIVPSSLSTGGQFLSIRSSAYESRPVARANSAVRPSTVQGGNDWTHPCIKDRRPNCTAFHSERYLL